MSENGAVTVQRRIVIRAIGRDFESSADSLDAWKRAKAFAEGYLWAMGGEIESVTLYQIDPTGVCLPSELDRVTWPIQ